MTKQATTFVDAQRLHAACKRYLDRRENIIAEKKKALLEQVMQERWLELFMRKPRSEEEAMSLDYFHEKVMWIEARGSHWADIVEQLQALCVLGHPSHINITQEQAHLLKEYWE